VLAYVGACGIEDAVAQAGWFEQWRQARAAAEQHVPNPIVGASVGEAGMVLKEPPAESQLAQQVAEGRTAEERLRTILRAAIRPMGTFQGLTDREREVLELLVGRYQFNNRGLAYELNISPKTLETHLESIYAKLGVATRSGATAVVYQIALGMLPRVNDELMLPVTPEFSKAPRRTA